MSSIRVLLVDDHALFRAGISSLLNMYDDIEVVGEAGNGDEAIQAVRELNPDVVLMDVSMPGMNGLVATRYLMEERPDLRILMLTQYSHREYVLSLLETGACGYVLKQAADTDLIKAIRAVHQGDTYLYPPIASIVTNALISGKTSDPLRNLSAREREVLIFVAQGYSNREIADILHISAKTVDVHRTRMMNKLGLHNVAEVVRYAIHRGLIESDFD